MMSIFLFVVHLILGFYAQQSTTTQRRQEMIVFRDSMDSHNEDGNWIIYDMNSVNIPIESPLDPTNMCWNIIPSNNNNHNNGVNPYFYRLTDLSPLFLSSPTIATLRYEILPYNMPPSMQCNVYYSVFDGDEVEWLLISKHNSSQNDQSFTSESFDIELTNYAHIGIKFELSSNIGQQRTFLFDTPEQNGCYINTVSLSLSTDYSAEQSMMADNSHAQLFISGNLD